MKKILFIILASFFIISIQGCSNNESLNSNQGIKVNNENNKQPKGTDSKLVVEQIVKEYLPHPFTPIIHTDSLEFKGKWAGNVMPGLAQEMDKLQWKLYDGMGAKKFYKKEINGQEIKISILPKEQGGPEEKNATTLVIVELEK